MFVNFRQGRGGGFLVVGTIKLAFVAAENGGGAAKDLYFFFGQFFFFLCQIGFAMPGIEMPFPDDAAGAMVLANVTVAAGKRQRAIGGHVQGGQDRANGDKGTVGGMDEAVVSAKESQSRLVR